MSSCSSIHFESGSSDFYPDTSGRGEPRVAKPASRPRKRKRLQAGSAGPTSDTSDEQQGGSQEQGLKRTKDVMASKSQDFDYTGSVEQIRCLDNDKLYSIHVRLLDRDCPVWEDFVMTCGSSTGPWTSDMPGERFEMWVIWMYERRISCEDVGASPTETIIKLLDAYGEPDFHACPNFQDAIMDELIRRLTDPGRVGDAPFVKDLLPRMLIAFPENTNRRLFVADWLAYCNPRKREDEGSLAECLTSQVDEVTLQYLGTVLLRQRYDGDSSPPWKNDPCCYHRHKEVGGECHRRTT